MFTFGASGHSTWYRRSINVRDGSLAVFGKSADQSRSVPKLDIMAVNGLLRFLQGFVVVGAFDKLGRTDDVSLAHSINAVFRHRWSPGTGGSATASLSHQRLQRAEPVMGQNVSLFTLESSVERHANIEMFALRPLYPMRSSSSRAVVVVQRPADGSLRHALHFAPLQVFWNYAVGASLADGHVTPVLQSRSCALPGAG